jgi:hypothetical protein
MLNKVYYKHKYGLDLDDRRLEWHFEQGKLIIDYLGKTVTLSKVELGGENFNDLYRYLFTRYS